MRTEPAWQSSQRVSGQLGPPDSSSGRGLLKQTFKPKGLGRIHKENLQRSGGCPQARGFLQTLASNRKTFQAGSSFQGPMKTPSGWKLRSMKQLSPSLRIREKFLRKYQPEMRGAIRKSALGMFRGNVRNFKSSRQNLIWNVNASGKRSANCTVGFSSTKTIPRQRSFD